jgi:dienelactone hydrolase
MLGRQVLIAIVAAAMAFSGIATAQGAPAPEGQLKAEWFTRDAYMSAPQISPDGTHLAWVQAGAIVIYNLNDETEKTVAGGNAAFDNVEWVNNEYLTGYVKSDEQRENNFIRIVARSPVVVTREGKYVRLLFERENQKMTAMDFKPIARYVDGPEPSVITIGETNTYVTEVRTGNWKIGPRLMQGASHFFDGTGQERLAVEATGGKLSYGASNVLFRYRSEAGGEQKILRLPRQDNVYCINFNYSEHENAIYWSEFDYGRGVVSIYRYDMATSERTLYKTGTNKNMNIRFDPKGRIIGFTTVIDRVETEWTDPYRIKLTAAIQKLFPQANLHIVDVSGDEKNVVLMISAPEEPDSYYYYDAQSKELSRIGGNFPELEDRTLAGMSYMTYLARDGLEIPAYVTKRKDTPANAPLVVLPHAGPAARNVYGFDYQAQFLASRGYVVLQPQYRGSAGFGDGHERAGNKNPAVMVTDLEDGVRFLAATGAIDASRVCIAGTSWGGYLAQASLALTPQTYACGISVNGISDLSAFLDESVETDWSGYSVEYWREVIGAPMRDGKHIKAASPIENIGAIQAPMLLIHGQAEWIFKARQSERMNEAMTKAGKQVTYMPVKYMHDGANTAERRLSTLKAMEAFIAEAFSKAEPAGKVN